MAMEAPGWLAPFPGVDRELMAAARRHWDGLLKPPGSLGRLEEAVVRIVGLTGRPRPDLGRRAILVFAADNGVAARKVSPAAPEMTAVLAGHLARGDLSICHMARIARARVIGVDLGILASPPPSGLLKRRIAAGTGDPGLGPAMSEEQAARALGHGFDLVRRLAGRGYRLLAAGEIGIGNTTTSAAVAAALLDRPPAELTGPGAGLSPAGVRRKVRIIEKILRVNRPDPGRPLEVLARVGGFDLAALAGMCLGGACCRVPILLDGVVSLAAALAAVRLRPEAADALLASHLSPEPAAGRILAELGLEPLIAAGLRLGEGTGAAAAIPLLDMAVAVYNGLPAYGECRP
ncbi:MAG: nicotinate-nucleotide--dimethylbenzimidazole phosphoribosyltransferase [Planctomycetota bacterium]|nr:nicotinate-nucleotide--dimethylbenzimidazole phosphoribosyltransferase [Planctomycetota bacterium]